LPDAISTNWSNMDFARLNGPCELARAERKRSAFARIRPSPDGGSFCLTLSRRRIAWLTTPLGRGVRGIARLIPRVALLAPCTPLDAVLLACAVALPAVLAPWAAVRPAVLAACAVARPAVWAACAVPLAAVLAACTAVLATVVATCATVDATFTGTVASAWIAM
jgi:hypothetical protein